MSTIVLRATKGSPLTHTEMDANFNNLNIDKVEGQASSVDSEIALFSGTGGKTIKRSTATGLLKATSGVLSTVVSGTDIKTVNGTTVVGSGDVATYGKQTIWIPAVAMIPRTTNGASVGTVESTTNKVMQKSLDFADGATIFYAQFAVRMPKSWNASTVTAEFIWTANSTSTNSVVWGIQGFTRGNDETIDQAFGTAVTVTDANTATAYQVHISSESSAITLSGAAKSEWAVFQVYRDPTNGSDTLAATANLLGVTLFYTMDAATDA